MPAASVSEFGDVSYRVGVKASAKFLLKARRRMNFARTAYQENLDKNMGNQLNFRVWKDLAPALSPLEPSLTPSGSSIEFDDVVATLEIFGNWTPLQRHINNTNEDPILKRYEDRLAYNMSDTFEMLTGKVLVQGTGVLYANDVASRADIEDSVSLDDFRNAVAELESENAEYITEIGSAEPGDNTHPIEEAYIAYAHSHLAKSLRGLSGFIPYASYANAKMVSLPNEMGIVDNVRICRSNHLSPIPGAGKTTSEKVRKTGGKADVYSIVIVANEAFGCTNLEGTEFSKLLISNPGTPSAADPLGQRGSVGWLSYFACSILDNDKMIRIECAASN